MPASVQHHHRSTTKVTQKAFKSRHATKSDLRDRSKGRVEKGLRQTKQQHVMTKLDRKNRAKQLRIKNLAAQVKAASVFAGRDGAPRIVAIVPLSSGVDQRLAVRQLNESVDVTEAFTEGTPFLSVHVERFKQNVTYLHVPRDLLAVLDACRMADFVVWVMDAREEAVDEVGETLVRAAQSQGISNVMATVQVSQTSPTTYDENTYGHIER
jgi:pre-rRNA-processing protein TSR1